MCGLVSMSDSENDAPVATSRIEKVKKARAPMTDTQKACLAKGRAKLAEQRQAVKDRVMDIEADPVNAVDAVPKKGKKPQRVVVMDDESDESEPEIHVVRRRRPKKEKQVVYESESEEDEDVDVPVVAKKAPQRRRTPAAPREHAEPPFTVQFF